MSVSNRPRGSERWAAARVGLTFAALLVVSPPGLAVAAPDCDASSVVLRLVPGGRLDGAVERFLREDQAWVGRQPVAARALTPPEGAQARIWLERLLGTAGRLPAVVPAAPPAGAGQPVPESPSRVADDGRGLLSRLRDRWLARGYLAIVCVAADSGGGAVAPPPHVNVAPGPRFRVGTVTVDGPDFPGRARALAAALPSAGAWFEPAAWEETVASLLAAAGEAGHPFARWIVQEVRVDAERAEVDVAATLFTGPAARLGSITSSLPSGRGTAFVRRAGGLTRGAPYRESALARARERLEARGVWAEVGEPLVTTTLGAADTVGVHWPIVAVARPNRITAVLGLSRRQSGATGSPTASRLSGQVDLLLPDLAGTGRRLALAWSDDGRDRSRLGFAYLEPLAFGTPLDLEGSLTHEVETDSYTRFSADLRARLAVSGLWGIEFGLGRDRGTYPTGSWSRTSRLRARAALLRRRAAVSRSGWAAQFGFETARRQIVVRDDTTGVTTSVPTGGTDERQELLDLACSGEAFLAPTLSLAARGNLAEVRGAGGPIPLAEQYRFGGARSLRGYREAAFHGERVAHGSLEIRLGRPGHSRLYTFFDLGYFRFRAVASSLAGTAAPTVREGTARGFGLGIETRAAGGDVSLAIGLPGRWAFDEALLHVLLLQTF